MSSRYRYNSQSYYNRSTGGQTNNPRVINRPYGVGYTSNQSDNIKTWISNIAHAGYYVNDSLESMANQLTKNGYYVSQEPPQTKILITGYSLSDNASIYNINELNYTSSQITVSISGTIFYIEKTATRYIVTIGQRSTTFNSMTIPANSYYSNNIEGDGNLLFYSKIDENNAPLMTIRDFFISDASWPAFYFYEECLDFDLPNN